MPETVRNRNLLFKPPNQWFFFIATQFDKYRGLLANHKAGIPEGTVTEMKGKVVKLRHIYGTQRRTVRGSQVAVNA